MRPCFASGSLEISGVRRRLRVEVEASQADLRAWNGCVIGAPLARALLPAGRPEPQAPPTPPGVFLCGSREAQPGEAGPAVSGAVVLSCIASPGLCFGSGLCGVCSLF